MAIVKMKRLQLLGLRSDQEALLKLLQRLGCVEISQRPEDDEALAGLSSPDDAALNEARNNAAELKTALETLRRYAKAKGGLFTPRPVVSEQELFDDGTCAESLSCAKRVNSASRRMAELRGEENKLRGEKLLLAPWLPLDTPLDAQDTREVKVQFGTVPGRYQLDAVISAVAGASELAQILPGASDADAHHLLLVCHKSAWADVSAALKEFGWSAVNLKGWTGTAKENDRQIDAALARTAKELASEESTISTLAGQTDALERTLDRVSQDITREENKLRLIDTDAAFLLNGWLPAENEGELRGALNGFQCALEIAEPRPEEYPEVPIKLKNNPVTAPFTAITEMYAMPAYDTVDPNPLMAPFFILFFGFMMNDIAYGLLMVLGTAFFLSKAKPKGGMRNMMSMFFMCGISSVFWGCVTGSFFGDFLPKLFELLGVSATVPGYHDAAGAFVWFWKPLFSPINDIILVMVGSMLLGLIQVFTGMAVSVEEKFRHGNALDAVTQEIAWYGILIGAALTIGGPMIPGAPAVLGTVGVVVMVVCVVLLPVGSILRSKSALGAVTWLWDAYQSISGYFSDILSYLRLMALMMAGSIIASVFNTLGSVFGLVPFIIVAIIGNALNLVLNLLGCYVHTMRLQCLEFFGRFYQDGGKPFRPLAVDTKYVDVQ